MNTVTLQGNKLKPNLLNMTLIRKKTKKKLQNLEQQYFHVLYTVHSKCVVLTCTALTVSTQTVLLLSATSVSAWCSDVLNSRVHNLSPLAGAVSN